MTNAERETRLANLENQASTFTSDVPPLLLMQIKKLKIELGNYQRRRGRRFLFSLRELIIKGVSKRLNGKY
jgi:hypothetical protein